MDSYPERERGQAMAEAAMADVRADFRAAREAFIAMEEAHSDGRLLGPEGPELSRRLRAVIESAHRAGAAIHELRG